MKHNLMTLLSFLILGTVISISNSSKNVEYLDIDPIDFEINQDKIKSEKVLVEKNKNMIRKLTDTQPLKSNSISQLLIQTTQDDKQHEEENQLLNPLNQSKNSFASKLGSIFSLFAFLILV